MQKLTVGCCPRRSRRAAFAALAVGACLTALTLGGPVRAQTPTATVPAAASKKVSLNLVNQPIQTALRLLFRSVGLNNSIDQNVRGYVTIDVSNVSFDVALRALLNAANPPLTYEVNGGVYHISIKRETPPLIQTPTPAATTATTAASVHSYRIPIDHYDAGMLAQIVGGGSSSFGGGQAVGGRSSFGNRGGSQRSVTIVPPNYTVGGGQGSGNRSGGGFSGGNSFGGGRGFSNSAGGGRGFGGGSRFGGGRGFGGRGF